LRHSPILATELGGDKLPDIEAHDSNSF
jgi:hypothetical protein